MISTLKKERKHRWGMNHQTFPPNSHKRGKSITCIVPLGVLPLEIEVAFPRESQLQQSHTTQPMVHAGCFNVFIIHRSLTWTTGSLMRAQALVCANAHGGVQTLLESLR